MLGEFSWKNQTHSRLNLSRGKRMSSRVAGKSSGFRSNTFKDIINERIHDAHSRLGDSSLRVYLSQDFVDVGRVSLSSLAFWQETWVSSKLVIFLPWVPSCVVVSISTIAQILKWFVP